MRGSDRLPRLILGDSPALCLKVARRLMKEARAAAESGDRALAGELWARAGETGAGLLPGAPASMYPSLETSARGEFKKSSLPAIWQAQALGRLSPLDLASNRVKSGEARIPNSSRFESLDREARAEIRRRAESEAEIELAHEVGLEAERISAERQARADRNHAMIASRLGIPAPGEEAEEAEEAA